MDLPTPVGRRPVPAYAGILLAAGEGRRFRASAGDEGADKLLAPLPDGRPVVLAAAEALRAVAAAVVIVLRPGRPALRDALARAQGCELIETIEAERGMGASLAAGARHLLARYDRGAEAVPHGVLVALGDMPWIAPDTLRAVCEAGLRHPIVAPACEGRRGHPVAFAWGLLPELAALDGDTGARALLQRHGVHELSCQDAGVLRDVDTVADLG
ncbi:nucleotidyltransferase family protein [Achromobacter aloeverae]